MAEFDIIKKYFTPDTQRNDVILGVGDDCAILQSPVDQQQVMTVDTLVSGVHFPVTTSASDIAYKLVAVNLSDLAAMGAKPAWAMLALTLPAIDNEWLQAFSSSLLQTLSTYNVQLIGGDTTQGPLAMSLQLTGFVDRHRSMKRGAAEIDELIFVTGTLGDAALGLAMLCNDDKNCSEVCLRRLNRPEPRVELGQLIAKHCSCAIDISDGLMANLGHILESSECGATICTEQLPVSEDFLHYYADRGEEPDWALPLCGGDDYELCFTARADAEHDLIELADSLAVKLSCIGRIEQKRGLRLVDADGHPCVLKAEGYQHFADN